MTLHLRVRTCFGLRVADALNQQEYTCSGNDYFRRAFKIGGTHTSRMDEYET